MNYSTAATLSSSTPRALPFAPAIRSDRWLVEKRPINGKESFEENTMSKRESNL